MWVLPSPFFLGDDLSNQESPGLLPVDDIQYMTHDGILPAPADKNVSVGLAEDGDVNRPAVEIDRYTWETWDLWNPTTSLSGVHVIFLFAPNLQVLFSWYFLPSPNESRYLLRILH